MSNLTKKVWNTLSRDTRKEIVSVIKGSPYPDYYNEIINYNYSHDFDYSSDGKRLKEILSHCRLQSDGTIDVVLTVRPTYGGVTKTIDQMIKERDKSLKATKNINYPTESQYDVDYEDKSGDLCHVWVMAHSKEDAIYKVKDEYWDIKEIIQVRKA